MGNIVNVIIQLVSGGLGGLGAGKLIPKISLGSIGDIIAGIVGGVGGGQLLTSLTGVSTGTTSVSGIIMSILGGAVGGGVLEAIVSLLKRLFTKK